MKYNSQKLLLVSTGKIKRSILRVSFRRTYLSDEIHVQNIVFNRIFNRNKELLATLINVDRGQNSVPDLSRLISRAFRRARFKNPLEVVIVSNTKRRLVFSFSDKYFAFSCPGISPFLLFAQRACPSEE